MTIGDGLARIGDSMEFIVFMISGAVLLFLLSRIDDDDEDPGPTPRLIYPSNPPLLRRKAR